MEKNNIKIYMFVEKPLNYVSITYAIKIIIKIERQFLNVLEF